MVISFAFVMNISLIPHSTRDLPRILFLASFWPNLDHQNFVFSNRKKFAVLKVECAMQYAALLVVFQHRLTHVSSGI